LTTEDTKISKVTNGGLFSVYFVIYARFVVPSVSA